jgi:hypothetical protein
MGPSSCGRHIRSNKPRRRRSSAGLRCSTILPPRRTTSRSTFGVLLPLIVADLARETGHYTTFLGLAGLAIGCRATLSTTVAGIVADHLGVGTALLSLAAIVSYAMALVLRGHQRR